MLLWNKLQSVLGVLPLQQLAYSPHHYPSPQGGRLTVDVEWADAYDKAEAFVSKLSLAEKVNLTSGIRDMGLCAGNTGDIPAHDFWGFCLQDGPLGVRPSDLVTGFGSGISAGATFNKELINARGHAIGYEFKYKGIDIALGPTVGPIGLKALGGRNFESFGADQYLQGVAGAETVKGMQDEGVMANAKHWIANEQEWDRRRISENLDDRTLHEVYAWPFADLIHAGVGSVMCSYNLINNSWGCENSYTLNKVLKDELGFQGFVMSDWDSTHSGVNAVTSGEDMDMPGSGFFGPNLTIAVLNETITMERLDDMATRIMAAYYKTNLDKSREERGPPNFSEHTLRDTDYLYPPIKSGPIVTVNKHVDVRRQFHYDVAYNTSVESVVLLKNNDGILPLSKANTQRITVLGGAARDGSHGSTCSHVGCRGSGEFGEVDGATQLGWGAGATYYPYFVSPYEGIMNRARKDWITVNGYFAPETDNEAFQIATSGSDVNIIFGLSSSGEKWDREHTNLWMNADETILAAAAQHPNNIVVVSSVGQINMEKWIDHDNITAAVFALPGGQDTGTAIADVLFGDTNPSGKLPFSIARDDKDYYDIVKAEDASNGHPQDDIIGQAGLYYDYRYFDQYKIEPRFEFGYGLSYSKFSYDDLEIKKVKQPSEYLPPPPRLLPATSSKSTLPPAYELVFPKGFSKVPKFIYPWIDSESQARKKGSYPFPDGYSTEQPEQASLAGGASGGNPALWEVAYKVSANVTNNSIDRPGKTVVQMYIGYPESEEYPSPPRQLRGFEKPYLNPHETARVELDILTRDLSVWDVKTASWVVQRGEYSVYIGSSSRDLSLYGIIRIE